MRDMTDSLRWCGPQPLTAPEVRPATIRFWNSRTMMTTGMVTTTAAAEMAPVGCSNWLAPVKNASAAGTVRAFSDVSEMAKTKSFQAVKKVMIAVVNTPGAASGTITLRNASQLEAPSTW